jgi:predicted ATPase
VINQLERSAGIGRDDAPNGKIEKLRALLALTDTSDDDTKLFAELLSLPAYEGVGAAEIGSERSKKRSLLALVRQIEGLAATQPVLMIFEDAHWSDPTSIELLNLVIERIRALPALLIVTFRPEFRLQWTSEPHVTVLVLNRLDPGNTADFVQRVAGGKVLPAAIVDQIVQRADGVPLFIEELTRAVLECGVLREEHDQYRLDGPLPAVAIPSSLQASLLARLDRLSPTRAIVQVGAAIGREFPHRLLSLVVDSNDAGLQLEITRLIEAGLVSRRGIAPEATYVFKR